MPDASPRPSMTPMRALLVEAADEQGPTPRIDRRNLLIGALLLGALVGSLAVAAASVLMADSSALTGSAGSGSAQPSTIPPTDASAVPGVSPGEDVAGSQRFVADFDLLPTDSEIAAWSSSDGARLVVAAVPTAVDRSARLEGVGRASACLDLDVAFSSFDALFLLDAVPPGGVTLLTLELDDGSTQRVSLSDGGATVAALGDAVELEARAWYRWVVSRTSAGLGMSLQTADGSPLAEAVAPGPDDGVRASEFCMATIASSRLYLNEMNVEAP
ncbi:MAG: hypothetical protein ACRDG7_03275 [Candidatus Limnocylindria bacterium]